MDKVTAWEYAIGMAKVDGGGVSPELLELIEKEKRGEITTEDMVKILTDKYTKEAKEEKY